MKTYQLETISDPTVRENFERLLAELREFPLLQGNFTFFELTFTAAVTHFRYKHNLGFMPKDVIQTRITGAGALTWNYSLFSTGYLDITTTGACVVRAFIGTFSEGSNA